MLCPRASLHTGHTELSGASSLQLAVHPLWLLIWNNISDVQDVDMPDRRVGRCDILDTYSWKESKPFRYSYFSLTEKSVTGMVEEVLELGGNGFCDRGVTDGSSDGGSEKMISKVRWTSRCRPG